MPEPVPKAEPDDEDEGEPDVYSEPDESARPAPEGADFTDESTGVAAPDEEMPEQDLAEIPDENTDIPEPEDTDAADDVDEEIADPFDGEEDVEVDLADTNVGSESIADTDDADEVDTDEGMDGDMAAKMEEGMAALSEEGQLPEIINEGFARLAVVGLEAGEEKDSLETEFNEVFESFRLGYFGSEAMEEYVLTGPEEEVDPLWAFTVSLALCSAVTVYMRPDGDEIVASAKDSLARFSGGVPGV